MRILVIFLASLVLTLQASAQNGFRSFEWGTPKAKIVQGEGKPALETTKSSLPVIVYEREIVDYSAVTIFILTPKNKRLAGGLYAFTEEYTNKNRFISDYRDISGLVSKKYGEPKKSDWEWSQDTYRGDSENYGMALQVGDLTLRETWENDQTLIEHVLTGGEYEVTHKIHYYSKDHLDVLQSTREKDALEAF